MLVLQRKIGQEIVIPTRQACVKVLEIQGNRVSFGVSAPPEVPVRRQEIFKRIQASNTASGEQPAKRMRVLLADPNQFLLLQNCNYLENCGFDVTTATDGLDCLEKLRSFRPDVLVLEPLMPWGGGDGVLAVMIEAQEVPIVPVIVLTHGCDAATLYNLSSYNIDDYQLKPLSPKRLAEKISYIAENRKQR